MNNIKKIFLLAAFPVMFLMVSDSVYCKANNYNGKRILYINSYHKGYFWSDREQDAAQNVLAGTGVELEVIYMDTKNNPSEEFNQQAGIKVKQYIEKFKPDVVISADDNAFKYAIMPYYRDANLPIVFCGINWDLSPYGAPYKNTTGMVEVGLIDGIYTHLKKFARGDRVGWIGADVLSERISGKYFNQHIPGGFTCTEYVQDFETWKKKCLEFQGKVDMIIVSTYTGIKNWNEDEAENFTLENIKIPIASESATKVALFVLEHIPQEQGEYAARTALRILDGEKPSDIPIVTNKRGDLYLNLKIADKLGVIFTPSMLRSAKVIMSKEERK